MAIKTGYKASAVIPFSSPTRPGKAAHPCGKTQTGKLLPVWCRDFLLWLTYYMRGPHPFPLCLLQSLVQYNPHCRLHHFTFQLRTLHHPVIDPHELALVTAPCLYSIWMHYEETDGYDDQGVPSYHAEAVYSMVRGLALNLKAVHMSQGAGCPEDEEGNPLPPPAPWKGLVVGSNASCAVGRLECIEIGCDVNHGLTTLLFTCADEQEQVYYDNVKQFLSCVPQLTSLEIIAWHPTMSLASALPPRLRELWLQSQLELGHYLDEAALAELADRCPEIETLALNIRRARGDATEVALYRALGRFTRLRRLALTLDASPPPWIPAAPPAVNRRDTVVDPSFDDFDRCYLNSGPGGLYPYRNGHIRDVFVNTAVDETLARTIFQVICEAQARNTMATRPPPLERMTVQVEGGRAFPNRATMAPVAFYLQPYLAALGRHWSLEREVGDHAGDVVHAQEIGKERRLGWEDGQREIGREKPSPLFLRIFWRIWPKKQGDLGEWWDNWRSYLLLVEG
ncbi:hypothetical protein DL546_005389 [Coniochaeta pulveracea]|uniref:F-box domain-containing protein n=1 Tax=Coniochaeta pulveracea TaxID=177199 RepID=A0A420Y8E6_9PEZI|nr:hypothetical protein DL546_005389 [Coniochaeta pulveracea]